MRAPGRTGGMPRAAASCAGLLVLLIAAAAPAPVRAQEDGPAAQTGARPVAEVLHEADAAYERDDYAAARPLYDEVARRDPGLVRALHRLALLESWDGDLKESIGHYRMARALEPDDPGILLGLAQTLAWKGRYAEAEAIYSDMVTRRIAPIKAHLGHALVLSWKGDLEEAATYYRDVLKADPGNLDARLGLARVYHWEGLNRVAREQADHLVTDHPESREALELQKTIHDTLRPLGEASGFRYSDRDSNRVDLGTLSHTFMAEEQTSIRIDYTNLRAEYRCQDALFCDEPGIGAGDLAEARAQILQAGLTARIIRPLTFQARLGAVRQETFGDDARTLLIGGGTIRWQVGPRLALAASGGREALLDTAPLIDRGIRVDSGDIRLEHRFHPSWTLTGSAGYGTYSDGNFRQSAGVSLLVTLPVARPHASVLLDARYRRFQEDLDNAYFDPLRYDSELLTLALWDQYRKGRIFWRIEATFGRQDFDTGAGAIQAGTDDTVQAFHVSAGAALGADATLELFYAQSDYALQLATGFSSSRSGFNFRLRF